MEAKVVRYSPNLPKNELLMQYYDNSIMIICLKNIIYRIVKFYTAFTRV